MGQLAAALVDAAVHRVEHLQVLFHAGLVGRRRSASAVIYSLADAELVAWCRYLAPRQLTGSTAHDERPAYEFFTRLGGSFVQPVDVSRDIGGKRVDDGRSRS